MINGLDLFSGIGGISLALKDLVKPIAYVEIDRYCQGVLRSRMAEKKLHQGEIHGDIKLFNGKPYKGEIDIIYGGFPCQDISIAGNGEGLGGRRSGLFFEIIRLTKEIRPSFVFLENVPAIRTRGLHRVIQEFTELRYDCRWTVVSAKEVGAHHLRKRWFMLAHSKSKGLERQRNGTICNKKTKPITVSENENVANPGGFKDRNKRKNKGQVIWEMGRRKEKHMDSSQWISEPSVDRVVNGLPFRVDRVKALGNSVVPLQVRTAFERLLKN